MAILHSVKAWLYKNRLLTSNPYVGDFSDGLSLVRLPPQWGWIDTTGKEVVTLKSTSCCIRQY